MKKRILLLAGFCLIAGAAALGQERADTSAQYNAAVHFQKQYELAGKAFAFQGKDHAAFVQWKAAFLPRLKERLGLAKIAGQLKGYAPRAYMRSSEDAGGFIRQRWLIWTEPTVPLPMVVLIPKHLPAGRRVPLVFTPHGHGKNPESYAGIYFDAAEKAYTEATGRDVAVQAVKQGYLVIAPTTRAFGETRTEEAKRDSVPFSCRIQLMHDLLVGRTPIGDRVWDISRILDWALENLPVDAQRVAITGNSGGGTVSLFAAACDERITVAAPSSYFCTFSESIGTIAHCDCNYIPGILELAEMGDVAGLIAPRPLCVINGVKDEIFPIEATRRAFSHLRMIYEAAGAPLQAELYEGAGGHQYYGDGSWPFIKKSFDSF